MKVDRGQLWSLWRDTSTRIATFRGQPPRTVAGWTDRVRQFWFDLRCEGFEHVPSRGGALLVARSSGPVAMDAATVLHALARRRPLGSTCAILDPSARLPSAAWLPDVELRHGGPEEALSELRAGRAVLIFPEGEAGRRRTMLGRSKVEPLGRGGFVRIAMEAAVPIVPVSIQGGERAFPVLAQLPRVARWLGLSSFSVSPVFPWLGPVGFLPLPATWRIRFGRPIPPARSGAEHDDFVLEGVLNELRRHFERGQ